MEIHASRRQVARSLKAFAPLLLPMMVVYWLLLMLGLKYVDQRFLGELLGAQAVAGGSFLAVVAFVAWYAQRVVRTIGSCRIVLSEQSLLVRAVPTGGWSAAEVEFELKDIQAVALGVPANTLTALAETIGKVTARGRRYASLNKELRQGRLVIRTAGGQARTFHYINYAFEPDDLGRLAGALDTARIPLVFL